MKRLTPKQRAALTALTADQKGRLHGRNLIFYRVNSRTLQSLSDRGLVSILCVTRVTELWRGGNLINERHQRLYAEDIYTITEAGRREVEDRLNAP